MNIAKNLDYDHEWIKTLQLICLDGFQRINIFKLQVFRLGVDFFFPLSQQEEQPLTKIYQKEMS